MTNKKSTDEINKIEDELASNDANIDAAAKPDEIKRSEADFDDYLLLKFEEGGLRRFSLAQNLASGKENLEKPLVREITSLRADPEDEDLEEQIEKTDSKFAKFIHQYSETIKGFYHLVHVTSFVRVDIKDSYINNRLVIFAKENLSVIEDAEGLIVYGITPDQYSNVERRTREVGEFLEGMKQLPGLLLLGLAARFDAQLASFVRLLLKDRPEAIGSRQSEFDLATVLSFADIDDLKDLFIDKEIYKLMNASHHEQIEFIEETFHVKIRDKVSGYSQFLEVFERRNLVAHGEGTVNARYDSRCKMHKVDEADRLALGEPIRLSSKYLLGATDVIYKFGIILIWSLWMKRHKEEMQLAYDVMTGVTFNLMLERRYSLVSSILEFLLKYKLKDADEASMRIFAVNRAICEKHLRSDEWRASVDEYQWGVCTSNFQICVAAIDEEVDRVCELMPAVSSDAVPREIRITASHFREWPAFHWVRDDSKFQERFKEIFGEEFSAVEESEVKSNDVEGEKGTVH